MLWTQFRDVAVAIALWKRGIRPLNPNTKIPPILGRVIWGWLAGPNLRDSHHWQSILVTLLASHKISTPIFRIKSLKPFVFNSVPCNSAPRYILILGHLINWGILPSCSNNKILWIHWTFVCRVAILLLTRKHHCSNVDRLLGTNKAKVYDLEISGYKVVQVSDI